jgi:signal transduction histidine kinase
MAQTDLAKKITKAIKTADQLIQDLKSLVKDLKPGEKDGEDKKDG